MCIRDSIWHVELVRTIQEASLANDNREIAWLAKAADPNEKLENMADDPADEKRFFQLQAKLAAAMGKAILDLPVRAKLRFKEVSAARTRENKILVGREMLFLYYEAIRSSPEATRSCIMDAVKAPVSYTHLTLPTKRIV